MVLAHIVPQKYLAGTATSIDQDRPGTCCLGLWVISHFTTCYQSWIPHVALSFSSWTLSQDQLSAMLQALHSPRIGPSGDSQTFEIEFHMKQISIHQVPEMIYSKVCHH